VAGAIMKGLIHACLIGLVLATASNAATVATIEVDGAIGPATAGYIARAIEVATEQRAECLLVRLDTPGGLLESTRDIVKAFYASAVPIVVHVAPAGAGATSAGCFITLASDVAAMTPGTTIGAAHPVTAGGGEPDETMKAKMENFAVSFVEAIARERGRNIDWARAAVRDSASITAEQALELNVIEILAIDQAALLRELDGREVKGRRLATAGAEIAPVPMLLRERVFHVLWRPELMFVLMLIAIYGIVGELSNPGAILPGVIGVIALVLTLYLAAVLPVNIAGFALIVLGLILFVAEVFTPAFGLLTVGGLAAFLLGALMLFDRVAPSFRLPMGLIVPAALITAAFFLFVVGAGLRAQRLPVRVGRETLAGSMAEALTDIDAESGRVFVQGESWCARSATPIAKGARVEVVAVHGLSLTVKPIEDRP
jgi:membrane-bound serine protease (ClpP class)